MSMSIGNLKTFVDGEKVKDVFLEAMRKDWFCIPFFD